MSRAPRKNPAAAALGRLGAAAGASKAGKASAAKLTAAQRSAKGRAAVNARWEDEAHVVPFDEYTWPQRIGVRLAPIDVGFDLRNREITVGIPRDTAAASYAVDGERFVVEGPARAIVAVLRRAGYRCALTAAPAS